MDVVFVGSNPAVLLKDEQGAPLAFASVWDAQWSTHGAGTVIALVRPSGVRVVTDKLELGRFLCSAFVRHFGEVEQVGGWQPPTFVSAPVELTIELGRGMRAVGGGVTVELSQPSSPRSFHQDGVDLGGFSYSLSNVTLACSVASVVVEGEHLRGTPDPGFLAVAEHWCR